MFCEIVLFLNFFCGGAIVIMCIVFRKELSLVFGLAMNIMGTYSSRKNGEQNLIDDITSALEGLPPNARGRHVETSTNTHKIQKVNNLKKRIQFTKPDSAQGTAN